MPRSHGLLVLSILFLILSQSTFATGKPVGDHTAHHERHGARMAHPIIYVNANIPVSGNGSSWAQAYKSLSDALAQPVPIFGNDYYIAKGTYLPTNAPDRTASFVVPAVCNLFGGFSGNGTETDTSQRDIVNNETILSGDIGVPGDNSDNAYHVVHVVGSTLAGGNLNGLTIRDGNANKDYPALTSQLDNTGGGVVYDGDGTNDVSMNIYWCTIKNNQAVYGGGLGIFGIVANSNSLIWNIDYNVIQNNTALQDGGGMAVYASNRTGSVMGYVKNCVFNTNTCNNPAGTSAIADVLNNVTQTKFNNMMNNVFYNQAFPVVSDVVDAATGHFQMQIYNSVFWNPAGPYPDGSFVTTAQDLYFDDNDIYLNTAATNNLNVDPLFVNAAAGDFHLQPCSRLINAGTSAGFNATDPDLDHHSRVQGYTDIGVYEYATNINPTAVTVFGPLSVCQYSTITPAMLTGNLIMTTGATLNWYDASNNPISGTPAPDLSTTASLNYFVSQSISGCEGPKKPFTINVKPSPDPLTVTSVDYCAGENGSLGMHLSPPSADVHLTWYTDATGSTIANPTPTVNTSTAGSQVFHVSTVFWANNCPSAVTTLTANVHQTAPPTTADANLTFCTGATPAPLDVTGADLQWYPYSNSGAATAGVPTPDLSTTGTKHYYISQTLDGCESARLDVTVTVGSATTAPTTDPVHICNSTAFSGGLSDYVHADPGATLHWYDASHNALPAMPTPGNTTSETYYVSQSSPTSCESAQALLQTVIDLPIAPVDPGIKYCPGATPGNLDVLVPKNGGSTAIFTWYDDLAGNNVITTPTISTATAGTQTFYLSQTNDLGCKSNIVPIAVTIGQADMPTASQTVYQYCTGSTAAPLDVTGTNLLWYTASSGGTGVVYPTNPVPATNAASVQHYYVTQTLGGCESGRLDISVTVSAPADAPQGLPTATIACQYSNIAQSYTSMISTNKSNLQWYDENMSALPGEPVRNTTTIVDTYFYVADMSTGCPGKLAKTNWSVTAASPVVNDPGLAYCLNSTAPALDVVLRSSTDQQLVWFDTPDGSNGPLAAAPVVNTSITGTQYFYVSQYFTNGNTCQSKPATITVQINQQAVPTLATTTPSVCEGSTPGGLGVTGSNLLWYTAASGGTGTATPTINTSSNGTYTVYVTQQAGGCESDRVPLTVSVQSPSTAPAAADVTYCLNDTPASLDQAVASATGTLTWYSDATGNSALPNTPTVNTATPGQQNFYVAQQTTGHCESPVTTVAVQVNKTNPPATNATAPMYCLGSEAQPLYVIGTDLQWYSNATGGSGVTYPQSPTPNTSLAGTQSYYVTQTLNGCESDRLAINVTVSANAASAPPLATNASYCLNEKAAPLQASGTDLLWYDTPVGGSADATPPVPATNVAGRFTYYVSQVSNGACESDRSPLIVTVRPLPELQVLGGEDAVCPGTTVPLHASGAATYQWSPVFNLSFNNSSDPIALVQSSITYTVTGKSLDGCTSSLQVKLLTAANCGVYVLPNAFSPNGDGHNDVFRLETFEAPPAFLMQIFSRWGNEIFHSRDIAIGWDGTMNGIAAEPGTYVYFIQLIDRDGKVITRKGTVSLVR